MRCFTLTWAAVLVASFTSSASAQVPPPYANQSFPEKRGCSNELFAVEVPLWAEPFPTSFVSDLRTRLIAALSVSWFCPPGKTCHRTDFYPLVRSILPDYSNPAVYPAVPGVRRDGHRRFYQVEFLRYGGGNWVRTSVLDDAACAVVNRIRAEVAAIVGTTPSSCTGSCPQPRFLVSRECLTQPLDVEAYLDPSTISWAQDRIGAGPPLTSTPIDVALVDAGVPASMRPGLGVVSERGLSSLYRPNPIEHHPHGAQMAALIRDAAPQATIRSYRALDEGGQATIGTLANALDAALFPSPTTSAPRNPLVINASLGFPPDLSRPAHLPGSSCNTWEDGLGESLRYVLHVASILDQAGPPVITVAAGGNQILDQTPIWKPWLLGEYTTPCGDKASYSSPGSPFLPAAFSRSFSCSRVVFYLWNIPFTFYLQTPLGVLDVGASDYADRSALTTLADAEPLVAAPGERVYVDHPVFPRAPTYLACGEADTGLSRAFEAPATLSGSSVSAAFASGAVARLLSARPERVAGSPWTAETLARAVYLTGEPVCRGDLSDVRRLSLSRIDSAISTPEQCQPFFTCLADSGHPARPMVDATATSICANALSACLGYDEPVPSSCSTLPSGEPGWPPGYVQTLNGSGCFETYNRPPGPSTAPPASEFALYEQSVLSLQPQPIVTGCPTCTLGISSGHGSFTIQAELTDGYPRDATLGDPYLVIFDRYKRPVWWISLEDTDACWRPGCTLRVTVQNPRPDESPSDPVVVLKEGGRAALDVLMRYGDEEARLLSPLAVEWW